MVATVEKLIPPKTDMGQKKGYVPFYTRYLEFHFLFMLSASGQWFRAVHARLADDKRWDG